MKAHCCTLFFLLFALTLSAENSRNDKVWLEFSLGYGSSHRNISHDIMGIQVRPVFQHKNMIFSAHYITFEQIGGLFSLEYIDINSSERHHNQGKVVGIQSGLSTDYKKMRAGCSVGPSEIWYYRKYSLFTDQIYEAKWFSALGISASLDLDWILLDKFGLKTSLYYNYNTERPFIMGNLGVMWGNLK